MQVLAVKSYRQDSPHQADRGGAMRGEQETRENVWSRAAGVSIAFLLFGLMPGTAWAESYGVTVEHNATAVMRDGTELRADIYRPKGAGECSVLLVRTPVDKT